MSSPPRVVVVTRPTDYQQLLERHGTRAQAEFFLNSRELAIEPIERRHEQTERAVRDVHAAIPLDWRSTSVVRRDLDRFVFEANDILVAVGQDGLVANVAKYLDSQPVIGVNPEPERFMGVLVRHAPRHIRRLLNRTVTGSAPIEHRTMVEARLDTGHELLALNELFIGHRTHQSARYHISFFEDGEHQSSSGILVSTGTGATARAASVCACRRNPAELPAPDADALCFFVREPYPSPDTGTSLTDGRIDNGLQLTVVSEMNEDGVIFGDGIEADRVPFPWGARVDVFVSRRRLALVA